ncbi:MAG TPA: reverse transcriptase-like protein [Candidatus Saccharimonadales bacterium]|nr:reverse transcriptase-like protein [Candidatus Saccharimonadales bacterium]
MKTIKLDHELAELIRQRKKTCTWRLFDEKDLSVDDRVILIDKVNPRDHDSWVVFGEAVLTKVVEKHLGDISKEDYDGHEEFASPQEMLKTYQGYYGDSVSFKTPVKVVHFEFFPYEHMQPLPDVPVVSYEKPGEIKLYADGGSRGNPGPSASGFVLYDMQDKPLVDKGIYLGITTNNQAEYTALKLGLEEARNMGARRVHVYMDSMLVVNQMKGIFKIKNRDLWPINEAIKDLVKQFEKVEFTHVPRELNKAADAAVNRAMDEVLRPKADAPQ